MIYKRKSADKLIKSSLKCPPHPPAAQKHIRCDLIQISSRSCPHLISTYYYEYSKNSAWNQHFRSLGMKITLNKWHGKLWVKKQNKTKQTKNKTKKQKKQSRTLSQTAKKSLKMDSSPRGSVINKQNKTHFFFKGCGV